MCGATTSTRARTSSTSAYGGYGRSSVPTRTSKRFAMRATGWLQRNAIEVLWGLFAIANWLAMIACPAWETVPFHFVWISLTIVYGFRVWSPGVTGLILSTVILATGASILADAFAGIQLLGEL